MARIISSALENMLPRETQYQRKQFKSASDLTGQAIAQANAVYESGITADIAQGIGGLKDTVMKKAKDYGAFRDIQNQEDAARERADSDALMAAGKIPGDDITGDIKARALMEAELMKRGMKWEPPRTPVPVEDPEYAERGLTTPEEIAAAKADEAGTLDVMQADARLRSGPSIDEILKRKARVQAANRVVGTGTKDTLGMRSTGTMTPAQAYEAAARSAEQTVDVTGQPGMRGRYAAEALRQKRDDVARGPTNPAERAERYRIAQRLYELDPTTYPMPAPEAEDPAALPAAERPVELLTPIQRVARSRAMDAAGTAPAATPEAASAPPSSSGAPRPPSVPAWTPPTASGGAVSPGTQAAAGQSQVRAEEMRAGLDSDEEKLNQQLAALGSVDEQMAAKARAFLAAEQDKAAKSDAEFLKATEKYADPDGPPEIIRDASGKAIDYKSREPITLNKLASLARLADTEAKQSRIMELSSQIELPYRTLSERLDPQRKTRFLGEIEKLFPATKKSPVEIALNNALTASKFIGMGVTAEQKEKGIALKAAGLDFSRDKLAHMLDQDQFKNMSAMDKAETYRMMAQAQMGAANARNASDNYLKWLMFKEDRKDKAEKAAQAEKEKREGKIEKKTDRKLDQIEKDIRDAEEAQRQFDSMEDEPTPPDPKAVKEAAKKPGKSGNTGVLAAEKANKDWQAKKRSLKMKADKKADLEAERQKLLDSGGSSDAGDRPTFGTSK